IGRHVKADHMIDNTDRPHVFKPHVLRKRDAGHLVGISTNDEAIVLLGCKLQESKVTGMNDVKVARDERYALVIATSHSYRARICQFSRSIMVIQCRSP